MPNPRRPLCELTDVAHPAWPEIADRVQATGERCVKLPADEARRVQVLEQVQVTLTSALGSLIWNCGGIVIDGWVRVYGSGCCELDRDPTSLPRERSWRRADGDGFSIVPVAEDVLGGVYVLNWGGLNQRDHLNEVFYFAPDTLEWERTQLKHSQLLCFFLDSQDGPDTFYERLRWEGWRDEVAHLNANEGIHVYPPPWTVEGRATARCSHRPVPMREILSFAFETRAQLDRGSID